MENRVRTGLRGRAWALVAGSVWVAAGCGGGGNGGTAAAPVQTPEAPAFERGRIQVSTYGPACSQLDCLNVNSAFIDDDGEVTLFWYEGMRGSSAVWYVSTSVPDSTATRPRLQLANATLSSGLLPLALGGKRFAAVLTEDPNWTSALVDLFSASAPLVSPRVTTPLDGTSQLIHGLDGTFAMGFSDKAPAGIFSLGGDTKALGVKLQRPTEYTNYWWQDFSAATTLTPTAWWGFTATPVNSATKRAYLAQVDLSTGKVTVEQSSAIKDWETRTGDQYCMNPYGPSFVVQEFARGQAAVGRMDYNPDTTLCDVFVDGVALASDHGSAGRGPALGGSSDGLVAVWSESNSDSPKQRVVWRRRDPTTNQWSAATSFSDQPLAYLDSYITGPGGNLAIAWEACSGTANSVCTPYVSKYVKGTWSTQQYAAAGTRPSWPRLSINAAGQAVVAWTNSYDVKCSSAEARNCLQAYAYRF